MSTKQDWIEIALVITFVILALLLIWAIFLPSIKWCQANYLYHNQVIECLIRENFIFGHLFR